ncbi:MAG: alpha/beta hydrolase-fold protein [Planctomycetota bacterium]|nr:alpha/beta hydrolase-fold protein [Planctomycetota bacterium]
MRHFLIPALALITVAADSFGQRQGGRRGRQRAEPVALENFEFKEVDFKSKSLMDGEGSFGLYLPKGWDAEENKDKELPLVVWLHGFGGYSEFQRRGGAKILDELLGEGEIAPMAFVTFRAPGGRRARSVYINGERSGDVEDAIVKDLVAYMEQNYPVSKSPAHHAIMGVSIGGFGALKIAMKHPEVFGVVAAHSSAIFPDDPDNLPRHYERQVGRMMRFGLSDVFGDPIDKEKWAAEMPMGLARNAEKDKYTNLAIYFDAGTEDRYGFAEPNEDLHKVMEAAGIKHTFRLVEGGGHAWSSDSMRPNMHESLKFVAKAVAGKGDSDNAKESGKEAEKKDDSGQQDNDK